MEFIKEIDETFQSIVLQDDILGERLIENTIAELQKQLIDRISQFAGTPIMNARTQKAIEIFESTDLEGLSALEKEQITGGIKQHKLQLAQNNANQEKAEEDIAFYQAMIANWQKILVKFSK